MTPPESDKFLGAGQYHTETGKPYCPQCGTLNVKEQGYDHNHRHHCYDCGITYWITRT